MKKTLTAIIILIVVLSLFMTSAFAKKPEGKTPQNAKGEESLQQEDEEDGQEDDNEGQKKPNEKRDAKVLFKETIKPLINEIHANREEWGALGDQQNGISESIEAKIAAIKANELALDEISLALFKEKIAKMKTLKAQMKGLKEEIQALWKQYISAKKISDTEAAIFAVNSLIAKQELRINIRKQMIGVLGEINGILDGAEAVNEEPDEESDDEESDE